MDASVSHDPFAPDDTTGGAAQPTTFRETRFRSAGATEEEIAAYREHFESLSPDEQANNNLIIDDADDDQMRAWIEEGRAEEATEQGDDSEPTEGDGESAAELAPTAAEEPPARKPSNRRSGSSRKASGK